jgi:hypothetical protein
MPIAHLSTHVIDDLLGLPERLLLAARSGDPIDPGFERLAELDEDDLAAVLSTERRAKAFWLTLYNAVVQAELRRDPALYDDRRAFFSNPRICVAGEWLSLDDVEHGIIRRSHPVWGLGYVSHPLPSSFERRLRLRERDPRIHFALNCGAKSCPAVMPFHAERVDGELDRATREYLETETERERIGPVTVLTVPRLFLWYRGDFGGGRGIRRFFRRHGIVDEDERVLLRYADYDWTLSVPGSEG